MFKRYIKYRIDRIFSKGLTHQLVVLVFVIVIILAVVSIFMKLVFDYPITKGFWDSLMQFIDTGNISAVEANLGIVVTFLSVTFIGVCGWGLLIAMINNLNDQGLERAYVLVQRIYLRNAVPGNGAIKEYDEKMSQLKGLLNL